MKGDFTRVSFDPRNHFSGVFQQQGRVTLDADVNENTAILLHHIRTLTRDLFGPHGGPADGNGFLLAVDSSGSTPRLTISAGHYYVEGLLCEAEVPCDYAEQPDWLPPPPDDAGAGGDPLLAWLASANRSPDQRFWVYLDVWERHVSWIEDERIREAALGGPDTCTRAKVVWQVKALPWDPAWSSTANRSPCVAPMVALSPLGSARMAAQLDPGQQIADPCTISPESRYRGAENQLYRVEIHHGGDASAASFKWSRDNGSVATRWLSTDGTDLVAKSARGFSAGDWVELSHDALDLAGLPGQLLRLSKVQGDRLTPDPASAGGDGVLAWSESFVNPKLRRWDQRGNDDVVLSEGAVPIDESSTIEPGWIALEDGIQVRFEA
ncbi:MAG TPA: DUF6519 domain-containing protein, partial [Ideonella sp.]|nr:DUF6519 domain-containing protein [Ideonella sp.]